MLSRAEYNEVANIFMASSTNNVFNSLLKNGTWIMLCKVMHQKIIYLMKKEMYEKMHRGQTCTFAISRTNSSSLYLSHFIFYCIDICIEAEFLDVIVIKVVRAFLLAI